MAAVSAPTITYTPHIDQNIIDKGLISDVQLENISYAGQAHEEVLESGERRGYFIGDGTGVGKGRVVLHPGDVGLNNGRFACSCSD